MKQILTILNLLILSLVQTLTAQSPSTFQWYFGNHIHFDFTSGNLEVDTINPFISFEGTCSVSNELGELLFISRGDLWESEEFSKVYDRNFNLMPNGDSLLACYSAIQSTIGVKIPYETDKYYLFTNSAAETNYINGINYSIIDMTLNNGLGDVDIAQKNVYLNNSETSNSEAMTIVRHCNGEDYWLISEEVICLDYPYECAPNGNFIIYLITTNNVTLAGNYQGVGYCCGQMKFNPQSTKMVYGGYIYDFNNQTGLFSNPINLNIEINTQSSIGMASFSASGTKLYLKEVWGSLYQFDLSENNFQNFPQEIEFDFPFFGLPNGPMQLAPDGKIYLSWSNAQYASPWPYIGVINYPENTGSNCDIDLNAINITGYSGQCLQSMPSYIESDIVTDPTTIDWSCHVDISEYNSSKEKLYPNPADNFVYLQSDKTQSIIKITILDGQGIIVKEKMDSFDKISISNLSTGYYFIKIIYSGHTSVVYNLIKI